MSKFIFSELKAFFMNPFPKRLISIPSIYLHHLGECIRQIKRQIQPYLLSGNAYTQRYISKFKCYYMFCMLCHKPCPWDFVIILPYIAESS